MEPKFHIELGNYCKFPAKYKELFKKAAKASLDKLPKKAARERLLTPGPYTLNISLVTQKQMQDLNRKYRGKDRPTDVLAFSRLEDVSMQPGPLFDAGDVVICPTVARKNAQSGFENELRTLTVHGILHVFGYDHENDEKSARKMFRLQKRILDAINAN